MTVSDKLAALRKLMKKNKIEAYIIPSTDPHGSEYVPALWQRRAWLSGFDGSAGDVIVTSDSAGLWTDSRYFLQAEDQLQDSGIELYKTGVPDTPTMTDFLRRQLQPGQNAGIDPRLISYSEAGKMRAELASLNIGIKFIEENLVDAIWTDQPALPGEEVLVWDEKFAGEPVSGKLNRIREKMAEEKCEVHVLTMLDALAWTFNIRSTDVDFNPVVIGYAIITKDSAEIFISKSKVNRKLKRHLRKIARIYNYTDFKKRLLKNVKRKSRVWLDGGSVNQWVVNLLQKKGQLFFKESPVTLFKACKNDTELAGYKACHIRDGVAMVKFLSWLESAVPQGGVTEISAAEQLEKFRAEQKLFMGPSFETISAYNEHGAIVHYTSSAETDVELKAPGIYLIDSGGQYLDGTTDITRTIALGEPTAEQRDRFTRVLKGHIDLAMTSFPRGTQGIQLDTLARQYLWEVGLNYGHGTGHGVGAFLGVHEGPQGISYYRGIGVPLEIGMICSNEPGFYKAGEYGIRIETLVNVVRDQEKSSEEFEFYKFETATFCPIDKKLIEPSMLNPGQLAYLNAYHKQTFEVLKPYVKGDVRRWLETATSPL